MQKNKDNIIFGFHAVTEAITANKSIEKIYFKHKINSRLFSEIYSLIKKHNIPFQYVPDGKIKSLVPPNANHQGIIAFLSPITYFELEEITQRSFETGKNPIFIVLDGITDIRNLGAIARTAECAGVDALIFKTKGSAPINNQAIKSSAGALFKIPVVRVSNLPKALNYLKDSGLQIIAATEKANNLIYNTNLTIPVAIVMGNEERGISKESLAKADKKVKIPILGQIESLNVANAASIIIYEAVRQRLNE